MESLRVNPDYGYVWEVKIARRAIIDQSIRHECPTLSFRLYRQLTFPSATHELQTVFRVAAVYDVWERPSHALCISW